MNNCVHSEEKENSKNFWLMILLFNIFIFFMAFIDSGVIIALFYMIWIFILYLTIFLIFRHTKNYELKEVKKKMNNYTNGTEVINASYTTVKNKNEFIIENDESLFSHQILLIFMISLVASAPIYILGIIYEAIEHSEVRVDPSYIAFILIFIMILSIPFIIAYLYYRNRITLCNIDKASKVILFRKISPKQKDLKKIFFSNVEDFGYSEDPMSTYYLKVRDKYGVKITLFEGWEEECIDIYNKISDFLGFKFPNELGNC